MSLETLKKKIMSGFEITTFILLKMLFSLSCSLKVLALEFYLLNALRTHKAIVLIGSIV